jgi:CyaY protein
MDRQQFLQLSDACLERVTRWCDCFDPDELEVSPADGVLTIEFADRARFVLNRQTAADQMWYAAGARAFHYDWDAQQQRWVDDRDGHDLYARIAGTVSEKLGRAVTL